MRKQATLQEYKKLYDEIEKLEKEKPWMNFEDMELFGLKIPGIKDKVYCSIMGFHQECYGVGIYRGKKGLEAIAAAADSVMTIPVKEYLLTEAGYSAVYFNSPEILSEQQEEILNKLNYPIDHAPALCMVEHGCFQDELKQEEVVFVGKVIEALNEAIACFYSLQEVFEFEQYIFLYDAEKKKYRKQPMNLEIKNYPFIVLEEETIEDLSKIEGNNEVWGIDIIYSQFSEMRHDGRAQRIKMLVVENPEEEIMLAALPIDPEDETDSIMDSLFEILDENGLPDKIFFRNPHVLSIIGHMCQSLNIQIGMKSDMDIIDGFIHVMEQEVFEEELKN